MAQKDRITLKSYFETGDKPSQSEYINRIDSTPNFLDDFATKYIKTEVNQAEILVLNSVPKVLVAAPGAGKILIPIKITTKLDYVSAAYATFTTAKIYWNGTTEAIGSIDLSKTEDYVFISTFTENKSGASALYENKNLELKAETGDPTLGDGTLTIHLWYKELTL